MCAILEMNLPHLEVELVCEVRWLHMHQCSKNIEYNYLARAQPDGLVSQKTVKGHTRLPQ